MSDPTASVDAAVDTPVADVAAAADVTVPVGTIEGLANRLGVILEPVFLALEGLGVGVTDTRQVLVDLQNLVKGM